MNFFEMIGLGFCGLVLICVVILLSAIAYGHIKINTRND